MKATIINPEDFNLKLWAELIAPIILRDILEEKDVSHDIIRKRLGCNLTRQSKI